MGSLRSYAAIEEPYIHSEKSAVGHAVGFTSRVDQV